MVLKCKNSDSGYLICQRKAINCMYVQACLKNIVGLVPGHCNTVSMAIKPVVIFVGRGFCLHFVKYIIFVKHNKVKCNKTKYVHIAKIIVYTGCGTTHGLKHPLGVLELTSHG